MPRPTRLDIAVVFLLSALSGAVSMAALDWLVRHAARALGQP